MLNPETTPAALRAAVDSTLAPEARAWLAEALTEAAKDLPGPGTPATSLPAWEVSFAAARRSCGPQAADAVRILLLHAARADAPTATRLYERGDAAERRSVLYALPHLDLGRAATGIVEDALRTNDTRLIAAAVGPYAAEHLDTHAWRHAVLKCLFTEVPLDNVAELSERARGDSELARMLRDYAREREAAGRPVPADLHRVLSLAETAT